MGHRFRFRVAFRQYVNLLCQIRRRRAADRLSNIAARKPLYRRRRRLDTLLQTAPCAVLRHFSFVLRRLTQRSGTQRRIFLPRLLQALKFAFRPRYIRCLRPDLCYQLRRLQPVLLFLLIEDLLKTRIRIFHIAVRKG
ncbi:hypothetical protein [Kalamiella sp. sgz302252]|uniref:hypothetical protein n=1 Tax=Pantoea sp. sgz302252 TaxID=3341827 RepID=UPI0036D2DCDF